MAQQQSFFGGGKILPISIRDEMRRSYIDYAMSVIVGRALPDVRDGLKPVHRRILYAMHELGLTPEKPFKKCAKVVGEVLGKYHPHGDTAVYDALVRLAQDFASRYPLVNGHGNFGSIEGDNAAAMRYTECKLTPLAMTMLQDIEQDTVDFLPNYDGSEEEPSVLPTRLPMLLLNGSSGIAVGMATNIPPFNLGEVVDGIIALIEQPDLTPTDMLHYIKGPDFPTGGQIVGLSGIREAFKTGRGSVLMRAVATIEQIPGSAGRHERTAIVVTEIPYQVNLTTLIEKIAELVRDKRIEGISDLRNESDRDGLRLVIELKRDAVPDVVLRNLYKYTQLQATFGVNMLSLVNNQPRLLNLVDMLDAFVDHRITVVERRTRFELRKAESRAHILAGLMIALGDLDRIIELIRKAESTDNARQQLMERYSLDLEQSNAILEMQLRRLTGLEREKISNEYEELRLRILDLKDILAHRARVLEIIKTELLELKDKYADPRRTQILPGEDDTDFSIEDLTPNDAMAVFITRNGYIKRIALDTFERQNRATRGKGGIKTRDEDDVLHFFTAGMHDQVLFFTNRGVVYSLRVYDLPESGRTSKGLAIVNLLPISQEEIITAVLPLEKLQECPFLVMLTQQGWIKKIELAHFENIRRSGIIAIGLEEADSLNWVSPCTDQDDVFLATSAGMAIRFPVSDLRPLGRTARGVTAVKLRTGDDIVSFSMVPSASSRAILVVTNDGFGKRCDASEFRAQSRGGIGLIATKFKNRDSRVASIAVVDDEDELMIVSANGVVIRLKAKDIPVQGRMATGVRIQNLDEHDWVSSVTKVTALDSAEETGHEPFADNGTGDDEQPDATPPGGQQTLLPPGE
ncbi:MAG: DNA gyrase subunit A [Candidatus Melainabacteria bacterium]|nr:DNA gyrase subunit A [Candidatus Melainabacteria bacterium]